MGSLSRGSWDFFWACGQQGDGDLLARVMWLAGMLGCRDDMQGSSIVVYNGGLDFDDGFVSGPVVGNSKVGTD